METGTYQSSVSTHETACATAHLPDETTPDNELVSPQPYPQTQTYLSPPDVLDEEPLAALLSYATSGSGLVLGSSPLELESRKEGSVLVAPPVNGLIVATATTEDEERHPAVEAWLQCELVDDGTDVRCPALPQWNKRL